MWKDMTVCWNPAAGCCFVIIWILKFLARKLFSRLHQLVVIFGIITIIQLTERFRSGLRLIKRINCDQCNTCNHQSELLMPAWRKCYLFEVLRLFKFSSSVRLEVFIRWKNYSSCAYCGRVSEIQPLDKMPVFVAASYRNHNQWKVVLMTNNSANRQCYARDLSWSSIQSSEPVDYWQKELLNKIILNLVLDSPWDHGRPRIPKTYESLRKKRSPNISFAFLISVKEQLRVNFYTKNLYLDRPSSKF